MQKSFSKTIYQRFGARELLNWVVAQVSHQAFVRNTNRGGFGIEQPSQALLEQRQNLGDRSASQLFCQVALKQQVRFYEMESVVKRSGHF